MSACVYCEGWGCRRCRKDYGEQMPDLLRRALPEIGHIPDSRAAREAQQKLKHDIAKALVLL